VSEVHTALKNAGIKGPYVLVGHSLGGLDARVYAGRFPEEVAGMVFVDHAINPMLLSPPGHKPLPPPPPMSSSPSAGPIGKPIGIESDPNFSKLSDRDRELHLWFVSQPRTEKSLQGHPNMLPGCVEQANAVVKENGHPLGDKPLVDVSTDENRSPAYVKLRNTSLSLSRNSKEMIAEKSSHFVIIDRPDVVVDAIRQAVPSARV
jgi:pimeloyl-ACP methyl ester carboxylesterase